MKLALPSDVRSQLDSVDLAYSAGLIDGEGYVTLMRPLRPGNQPRPLIAVSMTHEATVWRLHETFGRGAINYIAPRQKHHKSAWRWAVSARDALFAAELVEPFSTTKRHLHRQIIEHYITMMRSVVGNAGKRGEDNARARLTKADVIEMRNGKLSNKEAAAKFGGNPRQIWMVRTGRNWADV